MKSFERFGCFRLGRWRTSRLRSAAACLSLPLPRVISSSAATAASLSRASSELVPSDAAFKGALHEAARRRSGREYLFMAMVYLVQLHQIGWLVAPHPSR